MPPPLRAPRLPALAPASPAAGLLALPRRHGACSVQALTAERPCSQNRPQALGASGGAARRTRRPPPVVPAGLPHTMRAGPRALPCGQHRREALRSARALPYAHCCCRAGSCGPGRAPARVRCRRPCRRPLAVPDAAPAVSYTARSGRRCAGCGAGRAGALPRARCSSAVIASCA